MRGLDEMDAADILEAGGALKRDLDPRYARRANNRVACLGDSRLAYGILPASSPKGFSSNGIMPWLRFLSRQRIVHDTADNYAVSGYTTADVIANTLTSCVASSASSVVILLSTNDRTGASPLTAAQTIANLTTIRDALLDVGKVVVFLAEWPRGDLATTSARLTGAQLGNHLQVHRWLQLQAAVNGVYVADVWPSWMVSPATTTNIDVIAGYLFDGLHPAALGAYYAAKALLPIFTALYPPAEILPSSAAEAYDATNNPTGVLSFNPTTTGTGGTINTPAAGTMSGSLAASHVADLNNGTGLTVTLSKETISGLDWQKIVVTGTPTSASANLNIRLANANSIVTGDVIDAVAELQMDAGQTGMGTILLAASDNGNSVTWQDLGQQTGSSWNFPMPADALTGVLRVPWFVIGASPTTLGNYLNFAFIQSVAVSATIRFRGLSARKVS